MSTDRTTGQLPEGVAAEVLSAAEEQRAVLSLGTVRRIAAGIESLPLVEVAPTAAWLDGPGDRKPFSEIVWERSG